MPDAEMKNLMLLARALAALESPEEAIAFMQELCFPQEVRAIAQRLGIAELLMQGVTQVEIIELLRYGLRKPSTSTVNRVGNVVKNGGGHLCRVIARANGVEGS